VAVAVHRPHLEAIAAIPRLTIAAMVEARLTTIQLAVAAHLTQAVAMAVTGAMGATEIHFGTAFEGGSNRVDVVVADAAVAAVEVPGVATIVPDHPLMLVSVAPFMAATPSRAAWDLNPIRVTPLHPGPSR
jgi:hypothetical protein